MNQKYRLLDIDDLIILRRLGEGVRFVDVAKELLLTPPAISHRRRKYENIWEGFSAKPDPKGFHVLVINDTAKEICRRATAMLEVLVAV